MKYNLEKIWYFSKEEHGGNSMWINVKAILYVEFPQKHVSYAQRMSFLTGFSSGKIRLLKW